MSEPVPLYAPDAYVAKDPVAIVEQYPFAQLITTGPQGLLATATPILFETNDRRDVLIGHLAARNPQAVSIEAGQPALAIFAGPHTYISASWYRARPTVPTWNYVCAHVRGTIEPIDDPAQRLQVLARTADILERGSETPWALEQAPPGRVDFLLPQIRAFRIHVGRIDGVTKLSQTHPAPDRLRVIRQLLERGDGNSVAIAKLMARLEESSQ